MTNIFGIRVCILLSPLKVADVVSKIYGQQFASERIPA
jgi:hypothetical protein